MPSRSPAGPATSISAPWIARPRCPRALGELHRAGERVVVCQRERPVAQLARTPRELLRQGDTVQERVGRVAMQLYVWGRRHPAHAYGPERTSGPSTGRGRRPCSAPPRPRSPSSGGAAARRSTSGPPPARTRAGLDRFAVDLRGGSVGSIAHAPVSVVQRARQCGALTRRIGASPTRRSGTRESGSTQTARSAASCPASALGELGGRRAPGARRPGRGRRS